MIMLAPAKLKDWEFEIDDQFFQTYYDIVIFKNSSKTAWEQTLKMVSQTETSNTSNYGPISFLLGHQQSNGNQ